MSAPVAQNSWPQLRGKHALVTGGARGIGAATAQALLTHGARVTLLSRNSEKLADAKRNLSEHGEVYCATADVTKPNEVAKAFEDARARFGAIDILVNNAGMAVSAPFLKTDLELWRNTMSVNLDGAFHCTQVALPDMLASGWGRIVNVASVAGLVGQCYISAYCASKHALIGLTRALAAELAAKSITVNAVCPDYTDTEMVQNAISNIVKKTGRTREQALSELVAHNPQKRLVQPEEVAGTVAWLCLPANCAINGQAIVIAGGQVMA